MIDTSAIAAVYISEPDAFRFRDAIYAASHRLLPVSCVVEFCTLHRLGGDRQGWLLAFLDVLSVHVPPMTKEIGLLAASAAARFGRGSGHRAQLNFGDCMSYAHAVHFDVPLLFKGMDFTFTDISPVLEA